MKAIKTVSLFCGVLVGILTQATGQGFVNLDFEKARVVRPQPSYGFLDWGVAVPGWGHSQGGDTGTVYWGREHVGFSQYYLLMDATSPAYAPNTQLADRYSLAFASGIENGGDFNSPWINAYISQTGVIPEGTHSLQMLVSGPFQVFVGGVNVPMYSLGGLSYGGDISSFGGSSAEVKIMNTATTSHTPTIVDNIEFSTAAVPEPSVVAMLISGVTILFGYVRRRHSA